jgi:hypothetical protein
MPKGYKRTTLLINSANRTNPTGTSSANFIYPFPETIRNVVHTHLQSAVIENGIYNVLGGVNDSFVITFTATGATHTISIPATYYDTATLSWEITLQLGKINTLTNGLIPPSPSTFFCQIDTQGYCSIMNDLNHAWSITFPLPGTATLLGFPTTTGASFAPPITVGGSYRVIGTKPILLANNDLILIQSDRLSGDPFETKTNQGFSAWNSILNGSSNPDSSSITYLNPRPPDLSVVWTVPRDYEWVDIRLMDLQGKTVNIGTNNVQMVIEFYTDESARK